MATATPRLRAYSFYRPELRDLSYATGDVYSPEETSKAQAEWEIPTTDKTYPYLRHVKALSSTWPHLRLLADFMEITTTPLRWKDLKSLESKVIEKREERARRTNVTRLDYMDNDQIIDKNFTTPQQLTTSLKDINSKAQLTLFVVEDLSRDVIEALGDELDIEPAFFREHIDAYAWCNIRDRWQDPPNLKIITKRQRWIQLKYVTARYFKTSKVFRDGVKEAENFNVYRRPDDDLNNKAVFDEKEAIVGITRSRASFWMKSGDSKTKKGAVGVLLLDPTIRNGTPLWYGYRNWEPTPGVRDNHTPKNPPRDSIFNDFIHWAKNPQAFRTDTTATSHNNTHVPIQTLLHLVCADWLAISDYIRTRLLQIEWEVSIPDHFLEKGIGIDEALKKLHVWRRLVPLYREMLGETLSSVFQFPCHPMDACQRTITGVSTAPHTAPLITHNCTLHQSPLPLHTTKEQPISAFHSDFSRALALMEEYQSRIDRLTSVVTAIISIDDSRRGQDDNRNVARLTWLATFFIPLSYVASMFSMQQDVTDMMHTYRLYFATALPLAVVSLGLGVVLTLPVVQAWGSGVMVGIGKLGKRKRE